MDGEDATIEPPAGPSTAEAPAAAPEVPMKKHHVGKGQTNRCFYLPEDLDTRLGVVTKKLKESDPKGKWSGSMVVRAALEAWLPQHETPT